jgi:hypothetical protein
MIPPSAKRLAPKAKKNKRRKTRGYVQPQEEEIYGKNVIYNPALYVYIAIGVVYFT